VARVRCAALWIARSRIGATVLPDRTAHSSRAG
jgi:hypothetical protein